MNFNFKKLPPFKWFVLQNFPFIEADFDAITNYQLYCKIVEYVNKVTNELNILGIQSEKLTNAFNELKDYVDKYFDELNLQNEVDNKLDEMVEDGTMARIINEEIFTELYNEVQSIKNFSNVKNIIQPNIIEDISGDYNWYYPQGATFHNGMIYQYFQYQENNGDRSDYGDIRIYNPKTFSKSNTITGIKGYHGNDMCYLNNKLYIASCSTQGTLKNVLVVYDLSNNTTSEINTGINHQSLYGVSVLDENNLILAFNDNSQDINAQYFYVFNILTSSITQLTFDSNHYNLNYWSYIQNIEYYNSNLYILTSACNSIIECELENNTLKVQNIITLPLYDTRNLKIGECECIYHLEDELGRNTFGLSCGAQRNQILDNPVLQVYLINFKNGISEFPSYGYWDVSQNMYNSLYLNNTSTSLLELGTGTYPFKDLSRAIQSTTKSNTTIKITGGTFYKGCAIHGKSNLNIWLENSDNDVTISDLRFANCMAQITNSSTHNLIIQGQNNLYGGTAIFINDKTTLYLNNVIIDANAQNIGLSIDNSICIIQENCTLSNAIGDAIFIHSGILDGTPNFSNCSSYYVRNRNAIVKVKNESSLPYNKIVTEGTGTSIFNGDFVSNYPVNYNYSNKLSSINVESQSQIVRTGRVVTFNIMIKPNEQVNFNNNTTIFYIPEEITPSSNKTLNVSYNKICGFGFVRASDNAVRIQLTGDIASGTEIHITGSYVL